MDTPWAYYGYQSLQTISRRAAQSTQARKGKGERKLMNPTEALVESIGETATHRALGPDIVLAVQALMRELLAVPTLAPVVELLRRDNPAAETSWRFMANWIRPSRVLRGRRLPAGVTLTVVDEMWEEAVLAARGAVMAAPAAPTAAPAAPRTQPTLLSRVGEWGREMVALIPIAVAYGAPRLVGTILVAYTILAAFLWGMITALTRLVVSFQVEGGETWWTICTTVARFSLLLPLIVCVLDTLFTRFRGWRVAVGWAAFWSLITLPFAGYVMALGIAGFRLFAAFNDFSSSLETIRMVGDWLMGASLLIMAVEIWAVRASIQVADVGADAIANAVGGNVPLEKVEKGIGSLFGTFVAATALTYLAATRWPSPGMALAAIVTIPVSALCLYLLTWAGVPAGPWRKRAIVAFVIVVAVTTIWSIICVLWPSLAASIWGAPSQVHAIGASVVAEHRGPVTRAWHTLAKMHFISGLGLGAMCIIPALAFFDIFVGKGKTRGEKIAWTLIGVPSLFAILGIVVGGWIPALIRWTPPW